MLHHKYNRKPKENVICQPLLVHLCILLSCFYGFLIFLSSFLAEEKKEEMTEEEVEIRRIMGFSSFNTTKVYKCL